MQYLQFGATGESVSAIGLGCMGMVGWYGERDDAEARATIDRALELGITHLDTAAIYQDGDNERFVGQCLRGRRDEVFLATKCGIARNPEGGLTVDTRPATIRSSCDASLQRLETDHIDLFYLHRIDRTVPIEDAMGTMADLVAAGKIRFAGLSEASAETVRRANAAYPVSALQSELSLWTQSSARLSLEACRDLSIAFVAYSPLGRGLLTGAITGASDLPAGDMRLTNPRFDADNLQHNLEIARRLSKFADDKSCTAAQLALAWVLAQWEGVLPIPGTKKRGYLEDNAGAADIELSAAEFDAINHAIAEDLVHGERYPASMMNTVNV
jgi:aryl-alcohol dehydrogenase-like predicted oxidoreductase